MPFSTSFPNPPPFTLATPLAPQGGPSHLSLLTGFQSLRPLSGSPPWMGQLRAGGSLDLSELHCPFLMEILCLPAGLSVILVANLGRVGPNRSTFPAKSPSHSTFSDLNIWGMWCRQGHKCGLTPVSSFLPTMGLAEMTYLLRSLVSPPMKQRR